MADWGGFARALSTGGFVQSFSDAFGQIASVVGDMRQGLGGIVGDLGGLIPSQGPFQQCVVAALDADSSRYAFPQDFLWGWTDATVYNLDYVWVPAAVVYPRHVLDVSRVVACAAEFGVAVQAKSGGHSFLNFGRGGMNGSVSIDLRNLDDFRYDPSDQTVTFGPGNRLRDLNRQLAAIDRIMAYGVVGDIGTGGHVAIGGLGPLSRLLGLAADQVASVQCVLGNGSIVTASDHEHPDLFFAMKGAAWSFAIMTEITMQTSPPPSAVTSFQYNITAGDISDLADTFKRWQRFIADPQLSRNFASTLSLTTGNLLLFSGTFFGDEAAFQQLNLDVILPSDREARGITLASHVVTHLIHDLIDIATDLFGGVPAHFYANSLKYTASTQLSDAAVEKLFAYLDTADKGSPIWFVLWDLEGGAMNDIPQDATAYWHRDALYFQQGYVVNARGGAVSPTSRQFLTGLNELCRQLTTPGIGESAYAGLVDDALVDPLTAYWGGNVPRLRRIKAAYDANDTFRNPQSISPAVLVPE